MGAMTAMRGLTIAAALGAGTMGGVFFAFSTFVMTGLKRLPASQGLSAMQSINITAVTPAFMSLLGGTALLSAVAGVTGIVTWGDRQAILLMAGAVLYLGGAIVWTGLFHIPRNNALAALDPAAAGSAAQWATYLHAWVLGNHVRTLTSLGASLCFVVALL